MSRNICREIYDLPTLLFKPNTVHSSAFTLLDGGGIIDKIVVPAQADSIKVPYYVII